MGRSLTIVVSENNVLLRMRSSLPGDDTDISTVFIMVCVIDTSGTLSGRRESLGALVISCALSIQFSVCPRKQAEGNDSGIESDFPNGAYCSFGVFEISGLLIYFPVCSSVHVLLSCAGAYLFELTILL